MRISCRGLDWQLSSGAVLISFIPSIYTVEQLYTSTRLNIFNAIANDIENIRWLENFHSITAVKNLFVCKEFGPCIASIPQDFLWERVAVAGVLHAFLEGAGSPVAMSLRDVELKYSSDAKATSVMSPFSSVSHTMTAHTQYGRRWRVPMSMLATSRGSCCKFNRRQVHASLCLPPTL